ncbi:hypothetical protein A2U01_0098742, partial [Trifolium medium]|nr:hypothetical protein [Trifolium medium]
SGATRSAIVPGRFNILVLAQHARAGGATRSAIVPGWFNLLVLAQRASRWRNAQVYLVRVDFC